MRKCNPFIAIAAALMFFACNNQANTATASKDTLAQAVPDQQPAIDKVLTADQQAALTPDEIIDSLKTGNQRFTTNDLTLRNHSAMVRNAAAGQFPKAAIVSCVDSRVPVEDVFDKGIGDMFIARVAGNFVNTDILGSLEFACKVSGAKVIVVLGHEACGAVKAAIDDVKLGNITAMLQKIKPAVQQSAGFTGEKTSKNAAFVEYVSKKNILNNIAVITQQSPILKEMVDSGKLKIVGAYYNLKTGEVTFL